MCGIAAILSKNSPIPADDNRINRIIKRIRHRGPDDVGFSKDKFLHIGMCRLSIIDLVSSGLCPLIEIRNGQKYVLSYNGEIYNYIELREELQKKGYIFRTKSDTEVLLNSYIEWGTNCLEKFNGMFSFILADFENDMIFIARDRAGEKPLYWYEDENSLIFSSEIKGILELLGKVDIDLTDEFRTLEFCVGEETIFKGIKSLQPAKYMVIKGIRGNYSGYTIRGYWDVDSNVEFSNKTLSPKDEKKLVDRLDELVNDSIKLRMRADVPYGIYLSGGVDSSLIACISKPSICFYCHFPYGDKYDELGYAKSVAKKIKSEFVVVEPSKEDFENYLPKVIYHMDIPVGSFSMFPLFMLAMEARKYVKIVLSGEGADELFGGYIRYLLIYHQMEAYKIPEFRNYEPMLDFYFGSHLSSYAKLSNRSDLPNEIVERIFSKYFKFKDPINNLGYTDFKLSLVSLLQMEDRMSAAFGIENRTPFLDHRIVEFAFSISSDMKIRNYKTKYILRQVAKRYVPKIVSERKDKKGLVAPINLWINGSGSRGEFDRKKYMETCYEIFRKIFVDRSLSEYF